MHKLTKKPVHRN